MSYVRSIFVGEEYRGFEQDSLNPLGFSILCRDFVRILILDGMTDVSVRYYTDNARSKNVIGEEHRIC